MNAETVKVFSQSMPNLTNIFRIGRDVVKSNIVDDDKESRVMPATCTATSSVNRMRGMLNISLPFPINYLPSNEVQ